jgi:hypothetical protein
MSTIQQALADAGLISQQKAHLFHHYHPILREIHRLELQIEEDGGEEAVKTKPLLIRKNKLQEEAAKLKKKIGL